MNAKFQHTWMTAPTGLACRLNFVRWSADRSPEETPCLMTSLTTEIRPVFCPTAPEKIEDVGVSEGLLLDLIVRRLSLEGTANLTGLGEKLKLSYPVISHL